MNWNNRRDLEPCLNSIYGQEQGIAFEVIVVDNDSEDDSVALVESLFPQAILIVNPGNLGFSAGNNVGIRAARGRYVMLLNTDTIAHPGALAEMVRFMDACPKAGISGPKLLNRDRSLQYSCRHFPTLSAGFFRNTFLGRLFPKNRFAGDYLMTGWDHAETRAVDWVSGACMVVRRKALEDIGLLDESFFMYCEDVDWCYRAKEAGWKTYYHPEAVVTHAIGRSTDLAPNRMIVQFHRSMYRFYRKHYRRRYPFYLWPVIVGGLVFRTGMLVFNNKVIVPIKRLIKR
ncbi:MAG: glycosyltransferase family 2 protein [Armatimonadetes bacterium]|nr:glycosyltransferase family 2 protein [Armatimonadota bacterium]